MIYQEKRLVPRVPVQDLPKESVTLFVSGKTMQIEKLRDISSQGISLEMNRVLPIAQKLSMRYADKSASVEVHGRVAWCKVHPEGTSESPRYLLGLALLSPMMLLAVMPQSITAKL